MSGEVECGGGAYLGSYIHERPLVLELDDGAGDDVPALEGDPGRIQLVLHLGLREAHHFLQQRHVLGLHALPSGLKAREFALKRGPRKLVQHLAHGRSARFRGGQRYPSGYPWMEPALHNCCR